MAASEDQNLYSREAYTYRYRDRLRHQKDKQLETTKSWVLSLPQHRLDLRCHSTNSVKVDEFFHSTLYFQWCMRRLKKTPMARHFGKDEDEWANLVFEYMMAASERQPFDTYNLTDQQILVDAKEVFGVVDEKIVPPSVNSLGMLQFGKVSHRQSNETWDGMNCWAHRINRDADTIFETCRNEGLKFRSLPEGVSSEGDFTSRKKHMHSCKESDESHTPSRSRTASVPVSTTEQAQGAAGGRSPVIRHTEKARARKVVVEELKESESSPVEKHNLYEGMGRADQDKEEISAGPKDAGVVGDMSYKDVCLEISKAISDGAPTYNKGDHKGCYEVYKKAGEKIVDHCSIGGVLQELRAALELAETQSTFTEQAWTMRHAFDAIRCGDVDLSDLTDSDKEDLSPSIEKKSMGYKDACREIVAAIDRGAPAYNEGDHNGCYNTYKQSAEKIIERCSVVVVQIKLRTALEKAEKQPSYTDRAWTMRHAFDDIVDGVFDVSDLVPEDDAAEDEEEKESDDESMSYKDACREISSAISKGAPAYNEGDHSRCYNIYKQTADKIFECCRVEGVQHELRKALDDVTKQESFTTRAWTIRHAFDAILRGHFGEVRDFVASVRLSRDDPALALFSHLLGRRGTL